MTRLPPVIVAVAMLAVAPAGAKEAQPLPDKASTLVVYGDDPCPRSEGDDIVVCARKPETERYRIPKSLRGIEKGRDSVSWAARFADLEEATRFTRPNSCSAVGTWGQTGCLEVAIRQWYAARREAKARGE